NGVGVGTSRISVALFAEDGTLVSDADVTARFYRLAPVPDDEPEVAELVTETSLTSRTLDIDAEHQHAAPQGARMLPNGGPGDSSTRPVANTAPRDAETRAPAHEDALTTVYTANVEFDRAGWWGVAVDVTVDGET